MISSGHKTLPAIGFLTITRDAEHGLFGGYLVLNAVGRPLEFHCTAPVRSNRAQEILYGPTLEPYLYGERIGPTLLQKSKSAPIAVFTDVEPAMAARQFVSTPMLLVLRDPATSGPAADTLAGVRSTLLRSPRGEWRSATDGAIPLTPCPLRPATGCTRSGSADTTWRFHPTTRKIVRRFAATGLISPTKLIWTNRSGEFVKPLTRRAAVRDSSSRGSRSAVFFRIRGIGFQPVICVACRQAGSSSFTTFSLAS